MSKLWFLISFVVYEALGYLSNDMYLPAILVMTNDLGAPLDQIQLSVSVWVIGNGVGHVVLGPLSHYFGRKKIMLYGGVLYAATLMGCAASNVVEMLLFFRFLQGMGVASILISGYATIHEAYNDQQATRILSWTGCISVLAPMIGPFLGAIVMSQFSWRMIFIFLFLPSFACLWALAFSMPKDHRRPNDSLNLVRSFGEFKYLFACREFLRLSIAFGCFFSVLIVWLTSSPLLLMERFGFSERSFALSQIPIFFALACGAQTIRFLEKVMSYRSIILVGQKFSLLGAFMMLGAGYLDFVEGIIGAMALFAFGFGLFSAPLSRKAMTSTTLDQGIVTAGFFLIMDVIAGIASMSIALASDTSIKLACFIITLSSMGIILFAIIGLRKEINRSF